MARRSNRRNNAKNRVQNVRVVDRDETFDSIKTSAILSSMTSSNSQVRVVCGFQTQVTPGAALTGTVSYGDLFTTDDFITFQQQFSEFRVRAIQFRVFDVQPSAVINNFWATYHQIGGTVPASVNDVVDRPDARVLAPGAGYLELDWAAHGQPEMEFQSISSATSYGGMVYNVNPASAFTGTKYQVVAKFVVDFRCRI